MEDVFLHVIGSCINGDGNGNVYASAFFTGSVDFDPGAAPSNLTSTSSADMFVLKLDELGNFVWAQTNKDK